jgi:hypothetical protein
VNYGQDLHGAEGKSQAHADLLGLSMVAVGRPPQV